MRTLDTSVERLDGTTVKLSITVEPEAVEAAIEDAARRLASQVKVPGFRPGRVPRRVLESRLGAGTLVEEAAREALPGFYADAVQREDLNVVSPPEFDVDTFTAAAGATFTATVEVLPSFDVPDYEGLQVAHPEWEVTEEEVSAQLDALRDRFAELESVGRGADVGDYVLVTITGQRGGERLDEASGEDLLYRIGEAKETDSELDRQLIGAEAGAILKFDDTLGADYGQELAGVEVQFTAIVKEVKVKRLPALDDDFAVTASEFDTADELVTQVREQLAAAKLRYARSELRGKVVEQVGELVEVPLPQALVEQEMRFRLLRLNREAETHGLTLESYLEAVGQRSEELAANLETEARRTTKAQLLVDAVGAAAGIQVATEDLTEEIARQSQRLGRPAEELAQFMTHPDRVGALLSDAFRRKTIDHLLQRVQVLSGPPADDEAPDADEAFTRSEVDTVLAQAEAKAAAAREAANDDEAEAEAAREGDHDEHATDTAER